MQLLKYDELNAHRNAGLVFTNFKEGKIRFPPTFKCEPGKIVLNTLNTNIGHHHIAIGYFLQVDRDLKMIFHKLL